MARMIRPLANLYEQLRRLPGIGSKTAMRLAYHVIDMPAEDVKQLAAALSGAKEQIHYCSRCFNLTDSDVCEICRDSSRDSFTICVVEQPQDIATNSDVEGEATATYLAQLLKPVGITVSRIAHGLPMGGDLEYADEITLSKALENRRTM